ncbi:MAG: sugar ABC transporter ATP-binding protein [Ignavibacteria bacterium]|nr:sugar ABC transporter ATP-binding protein [Ignavibacteria bacterium]
MATADSREIVLRMQKIRKEFPGVLALDNVDFELREGEVHVLLGENGAGKSTLVKILSGAHQLTSGEILLFGKSVEIRSPRHSQQLGVGIIYQELNLISSLSAAENIFLGREKTNALGLIDTRALLASAHTLLDDLGLHINCDEPIKNFGIAQRQMIEVAKALSLDARILIMDEPTSALSETEIRQLFETIRRLKSTGVSVIYISHRLEEIFEIGDRVTVLRDGKLVGTKSINEISKSELVRMMVNRELKEHYPRQRTQIGEEVLRVEQLCTKSGLKDISFSLHRGEIVGVSGLLGSGRTELARAIFGADRIDSGNVYVKGILRTITSPRAAINLSIGFLTEDRKSQGLVLSLSVKENISLPSLDSFCRLGVINGRREEREAGSYVRDLRVKTPGLGQKALHLSGGNQQKVVLAKWLCSKADIFIFDEPTRGIDVGSKVEIYHLMNQLTASGVAIIMISSELPEILGMSDRILIMRQSRISADLPIAEASQEQIMRYALGA